MAASQQLKETIADVQSSSTVDWSPLGEIYVKKYVNYHLEWELNIADYHVAMAPYGGPVALLPRSAQKEKAHRRDMKIYVYTLSGSHLVSIPWEGGRLVGLGWNNAENLVCILEDGSMSVYDMRGVVQYTRIIAREVREHRVLACKFFHTLEGNAGFAVMTNNHQFFVVGDSDCGRDDLRVKKLADFPSATSRPSCWAVLPLANQMCVIAAVEDRLYVLDPFEAVQQTVVCKKDPPLYWAEVAVSLNGKAVALIDKGGYIWGGSPDFKICETEFDLQSGAKVQQMQWGGKDFFVLVMDRLMFVKGFSKHWCKYPLHSPCVLMPEIDGVRMLSSSTCEFMHRVTTHSLAVLRIGSMEVGALLNDAYKEYEGDESHKADEYIRFIKDRLPEAVTHCVKAAEEEFMPRVQQTLLKAANFGKGFLGPDIPRDVVNEFVEICHQLRVLNSVRDKAIGIPVTFRQYYRLSTAVLVDRLINRGLYQLALEICNYLRLAPANGEVKVLRQWALRKVQDKDCPDDAVAAAIIQRLQSTSVVVSFADIARAARTEGRNRLAAQLLDHEVYAKDQVPLLMDMKQADLALDKAIESGDPQLVFKVLDELKFKHYHSQTDKYLQLFHHRPVAAALYKKLCKETDPEQLLNLYRQESDFLEAGCLQLSQSLVKKDPDESRRCLFGAMKEFRDGQHLFHLKATEELHKLSKDQADIERKHSLRVTGLSLFNTILICVKNRHGKLAEQLRKDFKISDSQFWWAKLRGLAHIGDYEELERFSKQRKSPIGYEPFAEVCLRHGNRREAAKYVSRAAPENKFRLYMSIEDYHRAAETAFQDHRLDELEEVQLKAARDPELMETIRAFKSKLGFK